MAEEAIVRNVWTAEDEARLQELTSRKVRIHQEHRNPLVTVVLNEMPHIRSHEVEDVTDWLIDNADRLRVLLAPFAKE